MVVVFNNGDTAHFKSSDCDIYIDQGLLVIQTQDGQFYEYQLDEIESIKFEKKASY